MKKVMNFSSDDIPSAIPGPRNLDHVKNFRFFYLFPVRRL